MSDSKRIAVLSCELNRAQTIASHLDTPTLQVSLHTDAATVETLLHDFGLNALVMDYASNPAETLNDCEKLRGNPEMSGVPILMVCDVDDLPSLLDIYRFGAQDFVMEPYSSADIQARVRYHAEQCRLNQQQNGDDTPEHLDQVKQLLDNFDLITKVDLVKSELQQNSAGLIDHFDHMRKAMQEMEAQLNQAEYSLQFADRVSQQINEIGKLIYGVHIRVKRNRPYSDSESQSLKQSSSSSVLSETDTESTEDLLKALDL